MNTIVVNDSYAFPTTMDGKIWAKEFCARNSASDESIMLGWFANAIMAGYDEAMRRSKRTIEIQQERPTDSEMLDWLDAQGSFGRNVIVSKLDIRDAIRKAMEEERK